MHGKKNSIPSNNLVSQHDESCDKNNMCSCQKIKIVKHQILRCRNVFRYEVERTSMVSFK